MRGALFIYSKERPIFPIPGNGSRQSGLLLSRCLAAQGNAQAGNHNQQRAQANQCAVDAAVGAKCTQRDTSRGARG
jgi:hypothetical protein